MFFRDLEIVPLFAGSFILFFASCGMPDGLPTREPPLKTYFGDVGQGDACLLRTPSGKSYLYDIGNHEDMLVSLLEEAGVDSLEAVLISHPDLDHFGAFASLKPFPVKRWYLPETNSPDPAWARMLRVLDASRAILDTLYAGETLQWADGIAVEALWPPKGFSGSDNDLSLVLHIRHAGQSILLTGDIEAEAESALLQSGRDLSATLLKVAHHGSHTSSALPFLAAAAPRWAIISCDSTAYGHPHPETVAGLLRMIGDPERILRTDREGTIAFEVDENGVRRVSKRDVKGQMAK